jgi:hypothetical protein
MKGYHDYIPRKDAEFDAWFANSIGYLDAEGDAMGVPFAERKVLRQLYERWHEVYEAVLGPHTSVQTEAKVGARRRAERAIRVFKRRYVDAPETTDVNRTGLGFPVRDGTLTRGRKPQTWPEAVIDTSMIRQLSIRFKDWGSNCRAKPYGVHGAEIRWNMQDAPPRHIESELIHADFDTASPFTLVFDESDRGKRIYFALRWQNKTNLRGDWSEIYSAVIP